MSKRIYAATVINWLKENKTVLIATGIPGTLIGGIFLYLSMIGAIEIIAYSGDMVCSGTPEDPCYAYINFTANEDIFIYPTDYDPWGRNTSFEFNPGIKEWRLERSWGDGWRNIPLNKSCTGTWCGLSSSTDTRKFSIAFREGKTYQIRIVALKNDPIDVIKWGAFDTIDPIWLPVDKQDYTKLISNTPLCSNNCEQIYEITKVPNMTDEQLESFNILLTDMNEKQDYDGLVNDKIVKSFTSSSTFLYNFKLWYNTTKNFTINQGYYEPCLTGNLTCWVDDYINYPEETWQETDAEELKKILKKLPDNSNIQIKFTGKLTKDSYVDLVISYAGFTYPEYASWAYNVDVSDSAVALFQYYDNLSVSDIPGVWSTNGGNFSAVDYNYNGSSGKSANYTRASASNHLILTNAILWHNDRTSGNITYEFDYYMTPSVSGGEFGTYTGGALATGGLLDISLNSRCANSWGYWSGSGNACFNPNKDWITDAWEHIKITCDTATKNCQIQWNNNGSWATIPFRSDTTGTYTYFYVGASSDKNFLMDNFIAYNGTEPPTLPENTAPAINLTSPEDGNITIDTTPDFGINCSDVDADTLEVILYIDDVSYGTNTSVTSGEITYITANNTLTKGIKNWNASCNDGTDITTSTPRSIVIADIPAISNVDVTPYTRYTGFNFSVHDQDGSPVGLCFNGINFYIVGSISDKVYEYNLTGSYTGFNFSVGAQEEAAGGIYCNTSIFFVVGSTDTVYEYNITGNYTGFNFSAAGATASEGISFNGTNFWILDRDDHYVYEYNKSGSYTDFSFYVGSQDISMRGVFFYENYFYLIGLQHGLIYEYNLTGSYTGFNFSVGAQEELPQDLWFNGINFYIIGTKTDTVYEYIKTLLAYTNNTFTCTPTGTFVDSWTYEWQNNSVVLAGETSSTLSPDGFDVGDVINCTVYGINTTLNQITTNKSDTVTISNSLLTIYLENPEDGNTTDDSTPSFYFNVTDDNLEQPLECNLIVGSTPYGNDSNVVNGTSTTITTNDTLTDGDYVWYFNCTDSVNAIMSETRNITISTAVVDTCNPTSPLTADHTFNCSHYCNQTTALDAGGYNVFVLGDGAFVITADITNYGKDSKAEGLDSENICRITCSGGCFR